MQRVQDKGIQRKNQKKNLEKLGEFQVLFNFGSL